MVAVQPDVIELVEYHPWRRVLFFLLGFGVCAVATLAFVFTRPPEYTAVSQLRLVPAATIAAPDPVKSPAAINGVNFRTEVQVLTSQAVLEDAVTRLKKPGGLPGSVPIPLPLCSICYTPARSPGRRSWNYRLKAQSRIF